MASPRSPDATHRKLKPAELKAIYELGKANVIIESFKTQAARDRDEIQAMKDRQRKQIELIQALTIKEITGAVRDRQAIGTRRSDIATLRPPWQAAHCRA
jgi:hypothetical protein